MNNKCYHNVNIDLLIEKVVNWHHARNLIEGSNDQAQFVKLIEECGELAGNLAKQRKAPIKDDIGDIMVVLINIAERNDLCLKECLDYAWNQIKDRKGKMIDGVFVKDEN
jgi:NTP pyrophosphatase (non-canonical NTP hydrolase)